MAPQSVTHTHGPHAPTRMAPMPTYSSTNSEAEMEKKGTSASPATALATMHSRAARKADRLSHMLISYD